MDDRENANLSRLPIIKEKTIRAINTPKDRKAVGPDCIPVELFKLLDNRGISFCTEYVTKYITQGNSLPNG